MREKDFTKKFWAGIFFIASLFVIGIAIFVIGVERGFTEPKFTMTVLFQEVGGLGEGAPVRLSGVTVGTVAKIDFLGQEVSGRGVRVRLSIFKKFEKQLHKSTSFVIGTEGVLGDKVVGIHTSPEFVREDLSQPVLGGDPLDVKSIAEKFGSAAQSLQEASDSINQLSTEMQDMSASLRRILVRIEQKLIEGNLFKVF